jgi:hypothetical protein
MANLAAKDPAYCGPDVATRFAPGRTHGRPNRAWIRKIVNETNPEGQSEREQILRHQIEVAKSWEVRIIGRDQDGTPIKVASGRDSTEAAKFIYGLIGLRPLAKGDDPVALPPGLVTEGRSLLDITMDIYRHQLLSGKMTDSELTEMVRVLLAAEKDKALLFLKALGPKLASLQADKAAELQRQFEADPSKFIGLEAAENSASPPAAQTTAPPRTASEASPPAAGTLSPDPFTEADDDDSI